MQEKRSLSIEERVVQQLKNPKKASKEEQSKLLGINLSTTQNDDSSSLNEPSDHTYQMIAKTQAKYVPIKQTNVDLAFETKTQVARGRKQRD